MLYLAFFSFEKSWSLLPMMLSLVCFPTFSDVIHRVDFLFSGWNIPLV